MKMNLRKAVFGLFLFFLIQSLVSCIPIHDIPTEVKSSYLVGTGISDITGPAADVNLMGYAAPSQLSHGIHFRVFSRAYIFAEPDGKRFVYVVADMGMMDTLIYLRLYERLSAQFGDLYTKDNVMIAATHTHSAPGGYLGYLLYSLTALGFDTQSFNCIVDGIFESIVLAHNNMRPASMYLNAGELMDTNVNRSPTSYLNNPAEERARYAYDVDKEMKILKIVGDSDSEIGMISWFPVHPTTMNNTNLLISGDNKGYASQKFEAMKNPGAMPGSGKFIGAFALDANHGDVSPNTAGPRCIATGLPCDAYTSTCPDKDVCIAFGPGTNGDMFESTQILGENHVRKAVELYDTASKPVSGAIDYRHIYVDMHHYTVESGPTCEGSLGTSFAAGTTDGPGPLLFEQGTVEQSPFWEFIIDMLHPPAEDQIVCHTPKPILLHTGTGVKPWPWSPNIIDMHLARIGNLVIVGVSNEFTTMAGRRLKEAVKARLVERGVIPEDSYVVMALSGTYSNYVTTKEEYQMQRYEAASTLFGPRSLEAYIDNFLKMADDMAADVATPPGPNPPDLMSVQNSFNPGVVIDGSPIGVRFGDCVAAPQEAYTRNQIVTAEFQAANPRNDLRRGSTYFLVEKYVGAGPAPVQEASGWNDGAFVNSEGEEAAYAGEFDEEDWQVVYTDAHWETKFHWYRPSKVSPQSFAKFEWQTRDVDAAGTYRIRHFGKYKSAFGLKDYSGSTGTFLLQ